MADTGLAISLFKKQGWEATFNQLEANSIINYLKSLWSVWRPPGPKMYRDTGALVSWHSTLHLRTTLQYSTCKQSCFTQSLWYHKQPQCTIKPLVRFASCLVKGVQLTSRLGRIVWLTTVQIKTLILSHGFYSNTIQAYTFPPVVKVGTYRFPGAISLFHEQSMVAVFWLFRRHSRLRSPNHPWSIPW